jgi:hypothetical protein
MMICIYLLTKGAGMTIKLVDTTKKPYRTVDLPLGETTLYFPGPGETVVTVSEGDKILLEFDRMQKNVEIHKLLVTGEPITVGDLMMPIGEGGILLRAVEFVPQIGETVVSYSYGEQSGSVHLERA